MFCSSCGTQWSAWKPLCGACGAPLPPSAPTPPATTEDADVVARLGEMLCAHSTAIVDRRVREAVRGIGEDTQTTLQTIATSPEGRQLGARVAELDAASGGQIGRAFGILGGLLRARKPIK
jgi:hypothetical protein